MDGDGRRAARGQALELTYISGRERGYPGTVTAKTVYADR
jgi:hypothetical protein